MFASVLEHFDNGHMGFWSLGFPWINTATIFVAGLCILSLATLSSCYRNETFLNIFAVWKQVKSLFVLDLQHSLVTLGRGPKFNWWYSVADYTFNIIFWINIFGIFVGAFSVIGILAVPMILTFLVFYIYIFIVLIQRGYNVLSCFAMRTQFAALTYLLVLIEIIAFFIRYVSLFVRIVANITGGHILLGLVSAFIYTMISSYGFFIISLLGPLQFYLFLFALEVVISIVQAYVFTVLSCIYIGSFFRAG